MFTKINPKNDTQLSNEDLANLLFADALERMMQLSGLDKQQSLQLLQQQLPQRSEHSFSRQTKYQPVLNHNECNFITGLF